MKFKPMLLMLAVMLMLAPLFVTQAQEAPVPVENEADNVPEPVLLKPDEIKLWQAWIRGDLKGCYAQAQTMLESNGVCLIPLKLQTLCAKELGWHEAHVRDLRAILKLYPNDLSIELARWELIEALKRLGETKSIPEHTAKLGMILDWWVCGPFANERGQGFEDIQEPELKLDLNRTYTGKDGQLVQFCKLKTTPLDGTIDLGAMMRPNEEATAFLVTAIWCDDPQPDAMVYGAAEGSVKLGRPYDERDEQFKERRFSWTVSDEERDYAFDQVWFHLPDYSTQEGLKYKPGLQAGWNLIMVEAGSAKHGWRLQFRLEDVDSCRIAKNVEELQEAINRTRVAVAEKESSGGSGGFAYRRARSNIHEGQWRYLQGAKELLRPTYDRKSSEAKEELNKALKEFDAVPVGDEVHSILCYLAAWANRSAARYSSGREENRRRELLTECVELDPSASRALLELSQYYTTTFSNPALAYEYAKKAVRTNPDWIEARLYAARVVLMKGLDTEVDRELAKLLQEHPNHVGVLRFAGYYAGLRRDYKLSNELFEKALKADFTDSYSRERLLDRAVARGDLEAAATLADDTRRLDPFDTSSALMMSELYLNREEYSQGETELQAALKIAPRDDELLFRLGQIYTAWGDNSKGDESEKMHAKALEAFNAALEANPNREDIERYLQYLEGEQPAFEMALQEDIEERIETALEQSVNADNPYEVVYRDEIVLVNEDGTTSQYVQEAFRVTNDDGRDWLQRLSVPGYSGQTGRCVEARLFRQDGDIEEGRRSRFSASFPPLDVGDVVQARFRVTDKEQSFFGEFYGARKVLQDYVPVHEVRYAWVLPKGREFYTYTTGAAPGFEKTHVNGRQVWSVRATGLGKLHNEPLAPPSYQRGDTVQVSSYENWQDFGRWYYNLIRKQLEPTPEMTAEVNRITKGLTTEKEKATAVYNWVVTQVRYNADWHFGVHGYKPFSAGAVFARCIGDCKDKAILICTMLRITGVDAYPVIISLESFRGFEDITLPMPAHFNHAIAYIEYDDGTGQFVDGTATYNGIDELPGGDRGANVIVVRPTGGEKVRIPVGEPQDDSLTDTIDAKFAPGGTLKLTVKRTGAGDTASILRARYESPGGRVKQLEREWSEFYPGAQISDVTVNDLSDLNLQPVIEFSVELPNAYVKKDGRIEFRAGLNPREWTQTEFAALTNRKTALLVPAPFERLSVTTFKLPAGYSVASKPADLDVQHASADLRITLTEKDGALTVRRYYALKGQPVSPEDYPEFRRRLIEFDATERATIQFTK